MPVAETMTEAVVTVTSDRTVAQAALATHEGASSAAVVIDGERRPVGILTERDLVRVIVDGADPATVAVAERMSSPVVTVAPHTDVMEARELMGRHGVRHLPVTSDGVLVGMLEHANPRFGLHFEERRAIPDAARVRPGLLEGFRGPFADGPAPDALRVDVDTLDHFGLAEVRRGALIFVMLVWSILRALLRRRFDLVIHRREVTGWWDALSHGVVDGFEHLGPGWVKVGQIIASSPGVFPEPLADACQRTLDEVPPFDGETARRIIEEDLGHPVEHLFRSFDDRPLSAASIGQVHACVLPDGRQAVVKLQRPGIRRRIAADLRILYRIAKAAERWDWLSSASPIAIVEDAHHIAFQELNPALEAQRQHDFREKIGAFGDNEWITAPEVYWDYCGPRVICMERMYGVPMDEFDELDRRGVDGELVLRRGAKVWIEAVCLHGPFHGDMHAGNIWVLDDGRSSYLDFGIMGELSPEYRDLVKDILYTCMVDGDFTRIARAYRTVGVFPPDVGTDEELGQRLQMILGPMLQAGIGGMNLGEMLKMSIDLMDNYQAKAPKEMMLIAKQLAYIERYAKGLAPDYQLIQDVFLIQNIFPADAQAKAAELGLDLPR